MTLDLDAIATFFHEWLERNGDSGPVGEVARWLAEGSFEASIFVEILTRHDLTDNTAFRDSLLDLVLEYAVNRLEASPPGQLDPSDVRLLRMALHIEEDEFVRRRRDEVVDIVRRVLDRVLDDGVIEEFEDRYLVEVQTAFGLSFDQLLLLAQPALERTVRAIEARTGSADESERAEAIQRLDAIDQWYRLLDRYQSRRTSAA